jgi:hypothetical protein
VVGSVLPRRLPEPPQRHPPCCRVAVLPCCRAAVLRLARINFPSTHQGRGCGTGGAQVDDLVRATRGWAMTAGPFRRQARCTWKPRTSRTLTLPRPHPSRTLTLPRPEPSRAFNRRRAVDVRHRDARAAVDVRHRVLPWICPHHPSYPQFRLALGLPAVSARRLRACGCWLTVDRFRRCSCTTAQ